MDDSWNVRAAGGSPTCACGGRLALSAAPRPDTYQFVCVPCGRASAWFYVLHGKPVETSLAAPLTDAWGSQDGWPAWC